MRYLPFGKTGLTISEVGFGGIPIIRLGEDTAVKVVRRAYESGITLYDTANAYRDSEKKIGCALGDMRDKVVLATKTLCRDAPGTIEQLENSLHMMKTDYIDIYQIHQIAQEKDWEIVTGPGGAMEAVIKAKEQGKIRYIGVTSTTSPWRLSLLKPACSALSSFRSTSSRMLPKVSSTLLPASVEWESLP